MILSDYVLYIYNMLSCTTENYNSSYGTEDVSTWIATVKQSRSNDRTFALLVPPLHLRVSGGSGAAYSGYLPHQLQPHRYNLVCFLFLLFFSAVIFEFNYLFFQGWETGGDKNFGLKPNKRIPLINMYVRTVPEYIAAHIAYSTYILLRKDIIFNIFITKFVYRYIAIPPAPTFTYIRIAYPARATEISLQRCTTCFRLYLAFLSPSPGWEFIWSWSWQLRATLSHGFCKWISCVWFGKLGAAGEPDSVGWWIYFVEWMWGTLILELKSVDGWREYRIGELFVQLAFFVLSCGDSIHIWE